MFHLLAWTADVVTATLTDMTPIPDGIIPISNSHFLPGDDYDVFWALSLGTNLQRTRITTPRLRQVSPVFVRPIQPTLIGSNDVNANWMANMPLRLSREEEIVVESIQNAGVNQQLTTIAAIGRQRVPVPPGDEYTIRLTSSTAAAANAWTQIAYTLDSQLPQGRYAVIGSEMFSTNGQAHRFTFDNQFVRPGSPSVAAATHRLPYPFYGTDLGVYGYFVTYSLPRIEVLCNGADATHEGYLRVVKVA